MATQKHGVANKSSKNNRTAEGVMNKARNKKKKATTKTNGPAEKTYGPPLTGFSRKPAADFYPPESENRHLVPFCDPDEFRICIVGPRGSGKTSLVSQWSGHYTDLYYNRTRDLTARKFVFRPTDGGQPTKLVIEDTPGEDVDIRELLLPYIFFEIVPTYNLSTRSFCSVLFCSVLFSPALFCSILSCSAVPFCSVPSSSVQFSSIQFCSVLFRSVPFVPF
eukprot:gnl/Spiro4/8327_TR4379_c1_g1_i1.p1 gnl/Spiro4/8327_TR4379_c1_g1~~gnl/Spiro4/8327_TR4379_c1_g1_i1.p1  ORF type:complete len:221 (-),score=18.13 gnl/Spiro4/8327_TR4379_c1_g1_i1:269-931(-)